MSHPSKIELRTSPHLRGAHGVDKIMSNVVYALLPICAYAVYAFGISALALIITTLVTTLFTEWLFARLAGRPCTITDRSAAITGLLLALTLPPGFPLWMAAVAGFMAIALGKAIFGGLGYNPFNPALVGRAFVQAAFPVAITTWTPAFAPGRFLEFIPSTLALPFLSPAPVAEWISGLGIDGYSGATPLGLMASHSELPPTADLLFGMTNGSAGETSALLILVCGAYLAVRGFMNWRLPAAMLLGAFLFSGALYLYDASHYAPPLFMLLSGGMMLGAVFMASDMIASPVTPLGLWIYGGLMGVITVVIREFGALPEGVMYAILLGNAFSPLIEQVSQPRIYGERKRVKREEGQS